MPSRPAAPPAEKLLQLLLEQSADFALFFTTADGTVTDWYRGAEEIFGFTKEEMVGTTARRLFNDEDRARGADEHEMQVARAGGRAEDDRWHMRKDGTRFWGSGVLFALFDGGSDPVGYAKLVRNRTDLKTQTEALDNRSRALEDAEERTRIFLATLAHEMRSPLAPLTNVAELLRMGRPADEALGIIERQVALLSRLVEDLMDMARLRAGKLDLRLAVIDLVEVFELAARAARPRAESCGLDFQVMSVRAPVQVCADPQRLQQVFGNLLDNAMKYTPQGGKILFNLTTEGGEAIVRIEDNGVGMSAEILPRVFDLFTQEAPSSPHARGGLGVGLSVVKNLVELHHGTVQARSNGQGKGSVFTVRLPMHHAEQP